jgi:HK97 gp10 family phage protein
MANLILTGDKAIDKEIKRLADPKTTNKIVKKSMRTALRPVQQAVKGEAPSGETGQLQRAAKIRAGKRSRKGGVAMYVLISTKELDPFYGAFKQLGTRRMKRDDFMTRAYDHTKDSARANMIQLTKAGLEQEAKNAN